MWIHKLELRFFTRNWSFHPELSLFKQVCLSGNLQLYGGASTAWRGLENSCTVLFYSLFAAAKIVSWLLAGSRFGPGQAFWCTLRVFWDMNIHCIAHHASPYHALHFEEQHLSYHVLTVIYLMVLWSTRRSDINYDGIFGKTSRTDTDCHHIEILPTASWVENYGTVPVSHQAMLFSQNPNTDWPDNSSKSTWGN